MAIIKYILNEEQDEIKEMDEIIQVYKKLGKRDREKLKGFLKGIDFFQGIEVRESKREN